MARGRKKQEILTLEEQLVAVEKEITEYEGKLKALKEKKKALNNQIEEAQKEKYIVQSLRQGEALMKSLLHFLIRKKNKNKGQAAMGYKKILWRLFYGRD